MRLAWHPHQANKKPVSPEADPTLTAHGSKRETPTPGGFSEAVLQERVPQNKRHVKQRGITGTREQWGWAESVCWDLQRGVWALCWDLQRWAPLSRDIPLQCQNLCLWGRFRTLSWELTSCCSVPRLFHHPCHIPTLLGEQPGWWESKTYKQRLSLEREKFQLSLQMEQHLLLSVT